MFPPAQVPGTVSATLFRMCGVWLDHIQVFDLAGQALAADEASGTPGPAPWANLVYVDFDGTRYRQTNVTVRGRAPHHRSFTGTLVDGVLVFDKLGPDAPEHIGLSGGPDVLIFTPRQLDDAWQRYAEPDVIRLDGPGRRTRHTVLYRGGRAVRSLLAEGTRLAATAVRRVDEDPRGEGGPVHEERRPTEVFQK
jgi:hypothetical protein